MEWVHSWLKRAVAQSLSGARYDHYKALPVSTVKTMVSKILNDRTGLGPRTILTACRGIALDKGERKVRPVAIGEAIRRIAARVVCAQDNSLFAEILSEVMQFGVGIKGGIEYAYHSVRLHLERMHNQFEEQLSSGRHLDHQEMMRAVPAILKIDFRNGYNSTCRGKMLAQVEAKVPHLLRFACYLYAQRTKFVVVHKGQLVEVIESAFGSQQGDPLGGHFFALSIYDFMKQVRDEWPTACISWVVDDLTVVDTQERPLEVARMVDTEGPEYGLFKHDTKGEIYSPHNVGGWTPFRAFTHTLVQACA